MGVFDASRPECVNQFSIFWTTGGLDGRNTPTGEPGDGKEGLANRTRPHNKVLCEREAEVRDWG